MDNVNEIINSSKEKSKGLGKSVGAKTFLLAFLALLLLIPVYFVQGLIKERLSYRDEAQNEVYSMWGGDQVVSTPMLTLPYDYSCTKSVLKEINGKNEYVDEISECRDYLYFYPENIEMTSDFSSQFRKRGIFNVPLYSSKSTMKFEFDPLKYVKKKSYYAGIRWDKANISVGIKDPRGLQAPPVLLWEGNDYKLQNQYHNFLSNTSDLNLDIYMGTKGELNEAAELSMELEIDLKGAESFFVDAKGESFNFKAKSDWPSPSFSGYILPSDREVTKEGFVAEWNMLAINHGSSSFYENKESIEPRYRPQSNHIINDYRYQKAHSTGKGFGFYQMVEVDDYKMTDRSIKYVLLFIGLTFVLVLFLELMGKARIHSLQYLLMGLSLILFYVLLLSISEYLQFNISYLISTIAVVVQIGFFMKLLFKKNGIVILGMFLLSLLYGFLFVLLNLSELSLLVGSLGLFGILGVLMYFSNKIFNPSTLNKDA